MNFKTGSRNLDRLLHGGFPGGAVSTIMGEVGTGRTTLALATAVSAARRKQKVMYFDCEQSITSEMTFNLGLTQDVFNTMNPVNLEGCLEASLRLVKTGGFGLVILDSPTVLSSSRGSVASVAGMFTNWMPKVIAALRDNPNTAVLIGWQLRRGDTRARKKTENFGVPIALGHSTSVALVLEKQDDHDVEVTVTKDRRGVVHSEPPSCVIKFTGRGVFQDVRVSNEPIDRRKIPSRFDRDDPI